MGRKRKINETTGKSYRSDRDLVATFQNCSADVERLTTLKEKGPLGPIQQKKLVESEKKKLEAVYELWDKFFKLRMKMKFELIDLARRNNLKIQDIIDEYDAYAWNTFYTQIDGIELERVAHLPNWSMYIRIWGYWRSMNRDMLKEWFNWTLNTTQIEGIAKSENEKGDSSVTNLDVQSAKSNHYTVEKDYDMNLFKKVFWESIEELKVMLTEKQRKMLNLKINGMKNNALLKEMGINKKIYTEQIKFIKNQLNVVIKEVSKRHSFDCNFDELFEALAS